MARDPYTSALHADRSVADAPDVGPPIHVASTYERGAVTAYRRDRHQTTERLEAVMGALEGGAAVAYPSGMAAIAGLLRHLRPARVALPEDVYHGTREFVGAEAARGAWEVVEPVELREGDVWWVETPSNPKCLLTDVGAVAEQAAARGVVVAVDSTFATPVLQQPLTLGAGFVMHSTTKFVGGHSDTMGGVVVAADPADAEALRDARRRDGAIPGALDVWLALRGVRTLPLRVARQTETAGVVAEWLAGRVPRVWYPGLPGHPGHDVAARQMSGFGSIVSFEMGSFDEAAAVVSALRLIRVATSLGGVETLAEHRRTVNPTAPEALIRLTIGLEAPADLIADLAKALRSSRLPWTRG